MLVLLNVVERRCWFASSLLYFEDELYTFDQLSEKEMFEVYIFTKHFGLIVSLEVSVVGYEVLVSSLFFYEFCLLNAFFSDS